MTQRLRRLLQFQFAVIAIHVNDLVMHVVLVDHQDYQHAALAQLDELDVPYLGRGGMSEADNTGKVGYP